MCPNGATCGYCTVSGLGWNEQALTGAGGNVLDMATAMLETEKMDTSYTDGDGKTGDATNFGIFKQNWGMLRVSCNRFTGQTESQVRNWIRDQIVNNGAYSNDFRFWVNVPAI